MCPRNQTDRRTVLKTGSALLGAGAVGALSGCIDDAEETPTPSSDRDRLDDVPAGVDMVASFDTSAFLADTELQDGLDEWIQTYASVAGYGDQPENLQEVFSEFEAQTDLSLQKLGHLLMYQRAETEGQYYNATVIRADWAETEFVDSLEDDDTTLTETTYEDTTIYESDDDLLGVLSDGLYAIGSRQAVEETIDVRADRADSVGGRLKDTFEQTDGLLRFSAVVPDEVTDDIDIDEVDATSMNDVTHLGLGLAADGSQRSLSLFLATETADAASDVESTLQAGVALYDSDTERLSLTGDTTFDRALTEDFNRLAETVELSTDGTTAVATYTDSPKEVGEIASITAVLPLYLLTFAVTSSSSGGTDSSQETESVESDLSVLSAEGTDIQNGAIQTVRLLVRSESGSEDIDFSEAMVFYTTGDEYTDIAHRDREGYPQDATFAVETVEDDDDSIAEESVLNSPTDRANIVLDFGESVEGVDTSAAPALSAGETARVQLVATGAETHTTLTAPDSLAGKTSVSFF